MNAPSPHLMKSFPGLGGIGYDLCHDGVRQHDGTWVRVHAGGRIEWENREKYVEERRVGTSAYCSGFPVLEAAYDLAMQELHELQKSQGVFQTGAAWSTVWTRDSAYSIVLGLGLLAPEACWETLGVCVAAGEVIQDTGTGGAWPVSTDRVIWGLAAWELYLITGDKAKLTWACDILDRTCRRDDAVIRDMYGMVRGETSFMDWRSQSYPDWMTPSDIAESCGLSTMILHMQSRAVLADMFRALGREEEMVYWQEEAADLRSMINEMFWMEDLGYYGEFLYGRGYPTLARRSESLGGALSVLFKVAAGARAERVIASMPRYPLGLPCFHPQKTMEEGAYHNEAMWPFVEGFFVQAAAYVGNTEAMMASVASLLRAALICGTNIENVNLRTGTGEGNIQSSERQLWSIAGMLGMFYKGLFGISADVRSLYFEPCIPEEMEGCHELKGMRFRNLTFDLAVRGHGTEVGRCRINGKDAPALLSADAEGHYVVEIEMLPQENAPAGVVCKAPCYDLPYPRWKKDSGALAWEPVPGADYYRIFRNGIPVGQTEKTLMNVSGAVGLVQYQVKSVSLDGRESFLNEPRDFISADARMETRPCGLAGDELWHSEAGISERSVFFDVVIASAGVYRLDAWFSNGTCGFRDGNTCALRSVLMNGERVGSLVFPHLGECGDWTHFGYSSSLDVALAPGVYQIELVKTELDDNMNRRVNDCLIKNLRLTRMKVND